MEVKVTVTLHVDGCDPDEFDPDSAASGDPLLDRITDSVEEAVRNALQMGDDHGYTHDLESLISLSLLDIDAVIVDGPEELADAAGRKLKRTRVEEIAVDNLVHSSGPRDLAWQIVHGLDDAQLLQMATNEIGCFSPTALEDDEGDQDHQDQGQEP